MSLNVTGQPLEFVANIRTEGIPAQLKRLESEIAASSQRQIQATQNIFKGIALGAASLGAAQAVIGFFGDSIQEALDAEEATTRFKSTLESIGRIDAFDRLSEQADRMAEKFAYLDNDDVTGVLERLVSAGKFSEKQINDLLPIIIDFAAKQNVSLATAADNINKFIETGRGMKGFGLDVKGVKTESERLSLVMGTLKSRVEGAAEAFGETTKGNIASARQEFAEIKEEIGTGLLPLLNQLLSVFVQAGKGAFQMAKDIRTAFSDAVSQGSSMIKTFRNVALEAATIQQVAVERASKFSKSDNKDLDQRIGVLLSKISEAEKVVAAKKRAIEEGFANASDSDALTAFSNKATILRAEIKELEKLKALNSNKTTFGEGLFNPADKVKTAKKDAVNELLNDRKNLLEKIRDIQLKSYQSGLTDDALAISQVSAGYEELIRLVNEYNEKAKKAGSPTISTTEITEAKNVNLRNEALKRDAQAFIQNLEVQKSAYTQFEEAKKRIGIEKAKEMYKGQTNEADSYLQYLEQEAGKILFKRDVGKKLLDVGELDKLKALMDEIKSVRGELAQDEKQQLIDLIQFTTTFEAKRSSINQRYAEQEAALIKLNTVLTREEYAERAQILKDSKDKELTELENAAIRQSDLYKKLGADLIGYSREQIKGQVALLKDSLKKGTFTDALGKEQELSPEFKRQIEAYIKTLEEFYTSTADVFGLSVQQIEEYAGQLGEISGIFGELSGALEGVNDELAATFETLSDITGVASSVASAIGQFANGNIIAGIGSVVKAIAGIFSIGKKSRESAREAQAEVDAFTSRILAGEIEITQEYRKRQREIITNNKLTLQGLTDQKRLLEEQKRAQADSFDSLLKQIQGLSFAAGQETEKFGGVLGIGRKSRVVEISASLAGKGYDELEQLFIKGQLNGKAKELFEQLQKIKQEGADIDALLEQNRLEAQKVFTGTTSDSILDSIIQGFADGKRSAADFADTFEELMKGAVLNALKYQTLEAPLKEFYAQFAALSESGGVLTEDEIKELEARYSGIIKTAGERFEELKRVTGMDFSGGGSGGTLSGAIKGITEQQADLLAGQFGGLRITALEHLQVATRSLQVHQNIELNTGATVVEMRNMIAKMENYYNVVGVKIR